MVYRIANWILPRALIVGGLVWIVYGIAADQLAISWLGVVSAALGSHLIGDDHK